MLQVNGNGILSELERAAVDLLLAGQDPVLFALRGQRGSGSVSSITNTGTGLWIEYAIPESKINLPRNLSFCFSDIAGELLPGDVPIGFTLRVDGGALSLLEAFTFDPEPWPDHVEGFRLRYLDGTRDLQETRKAWSQHFSERAED